MSERNPLSECQIANTTITLGEELHENDSQPCINAPEEGNKENPLKASKARKSILKVFDPFYVGSPSSKSFTQTENLNLIGEEQFPCSDFKESLYETYCLETSKDHTFDIAESEAVHSVPAEFIDSKECNHTFTLLEPEKCEKDIESSKSFVSEILGDLLSQLNLNDSVNSDIICKNNEASINDQDISAIGFPSLGENELGDYCQQSSTPTVVNEKLTVANLSEKPEIAYENTVAKFLSPTESVAVEVVPVESNTDLLQEVEVGAIEENIAKVNNSSIINITSVETEFSNAEAFQENIEDKTLVPDDNKDDQVISVNCTEVQQSFTPTIITEEITVANINGKPEIAHENTIENLISTTESVAVEALHFESNTDHIEEIEVNYINNTIEEAIPNINNSSIININVEPEYSNIESFQENIADKTLVPDFDKVEKIVSSNSAEAVSKESTSDLETKVSYLEDTFNETVTNSSPHCFVNLKENVLDTNISLLEKTAINNVIEEISTNNTTESSQILEDNLIKLRSANVQATIADNIDCPVDLIQNTVGVNIHYSKREEVQNDIEGTKSPIKQAASLISDTVSCTEDEHVLDVETAIPDLRAARKLIFNKEFAKLRTIVNPNDPHKVCDKTMSDLTDMTNLQEQDICDLKLQLNQSQQARASLELQVRQKEEILIKTQVEAQKKEQEIRQLHEKLNAKDEQPSPDTRLKELQEALLEYKSKEEQLQNQLKHKSSEGSEYITAMEEYEKQFKLQLEDLERVKNEYYNTKRHLTNLEIAFSDVHQKYEKCKTVIEGYKRNEVTLYEDVRQYQDAIKKNDERYDALKAHAKAQIDKCNLEIRTTTDKYEMEITKSNALVKRLQIKLDSVTNLLNQKTKECDGLAEICDAVTGKVP